MRTFNAAEILTRMKNTSGISSDKDLSGLLGVKTTTYSSWKNNNSIPLNVLIDFANSHNLSMDWLLFGQDPDVLTQNEKLVLYAYNSLSDKQKLNLMGAMMGLDCCKDVPSSGGLNIDQSNNNGGTNNYITGDYTINNATKGIKK